MSQYILNGLVWIYFGTSPDRKMFPWKITEQSTSNTNTSYHVINTAHKSSKISKNQIFTKNLFLFFIALQVWTQSGRPIDFEVFTVVIVQIGVFWTAMTCDLIDRCQHFLKTCRFHLQNRNIRPCGLVHDILPKSFHVRTRLHGVTILKTPYLSKKVA
jgi:hypothetical protein